MWGRGMKTKRQANQRTTYECFGYSVYGFARRLGVTANDVNWLIKNGYIQMQRSPWALPRWNINKDQIVLAEAALLGCCAASRRGALFRASRQAVSNDEAIQECIAAQLGGG